jgi:hypothetical protein
MSCRTDMTIDIDMRTDITNMKIDIETDMKTDMKIEIKTDKKIEMLAVMNHKKAKT